MNISHINVDSEEMPVATPVVPANFEAEAEERLHVDGRGRIRLSENFWCHMGRYIHARNLVQAASKAAPDKPMRVLDAASGTGYGTYLLSRGGHRCDGVDLDAEAVAFSQKVYGGPNCHFSTGTVLELPFERDTFDFAVSFETIEHLPRDQQKPFLEELSRVLKPSGQLVLSAPVVPGGVQHPDHNAFHAYEPDPFELIALMQSVFKTVTVRGQIIRSANYATIAQQTSSQTQPSSDDAGGSESSAASESGKTRAMKRVRGVARGVSNRVLQPFYLDYPASLRMVMKTFYTGHLVKEMNLETQSAAFLVVEARS